MKNKTIFLFSTIAVLTITGCTDKTSAVLSSEQEISVSESVKDSENSIVSSNSVASVSSAGFVKNQISNDNGMVINFDKHGAKIDSIYYDDLKIGENGFIAGRCANRIANAKFTLDGVNYTLTKNAWDQHQLHGGPKGFGEIDWTYVEQTNKSIKFSLHSADKDQGYPGNLDMTTTYTLENDGSLIIEFNAVCDKKTVFNPINHLYMNLNGDNSAKNHQLQINADTYTETKNLIPTGKILSVEGQKWDYREMKTYTVSDKNDINVCTNNYVKGTVRKVAEMKGTKSGIKVEVMSDRPGLQLYNTDERICLEAQHYPDAIHHQDDENWPTVILEANENYYSKLVYKFTKEA